MRRSFGVLFSLLLISSPLSSQATETPEQVAGRFVAAMSAEDWQGMGTLMHPMALKEMRQFLAVLFEMPDADEFRQRLLGVKTLGDAQALSDTAVFVSLMKNMSEQAGIGAMLRSAKVQMMGHVNQGKDTAHVVYRMSMTMEGIPISKMDVMSLARSPVGWRGLLQGDISALGAGIRAALQNQKN